MVKLSTLMEYLDTQINLTTVVILVMAAVMVWFGIKRVVGLVLGELRGFDGWRRGIALFCVGGCIAGPGMITWGITDLMQAPSAENRVAKTFGCGDLRSMVNDKESTPEKMKAVFDYERELPQPTLSRPELLTGNPWRGSLLIGLGLGLLVVIIPVSIKHFAN